MLLTPKMGVGASDAKDGCRRFRGADQVRVAQMRRLGAVESVEAEGRVGVEVGRVVKSLF